MRAWRRYVLYYLKTGFWFVPLLCLAAAVALAYVLPAVDGTGFGRWLGAFLPAFDHDSTRPLLVALVGSLVTAASLVFSITLVVLTMATGQMAPRIIPRFLADRMTQVVIGVFIAGIVYLILILSRISLEDRTILPVAFGIALALLCFLLLIAFVHHLARSIQVDSVISVVGKSLQEQICNAFPPQGETPRTSEPEIPDETDQLFSEHAGYVQVVDYEGLVDVARRRGLFLRMLVGPGSSLFHATPIAEVWPRGRMTKSDATRLRSNVAIGPPAQDVEYRVYALVEIGLRALSPGVNEPHTATAVLDRLGAAIALLFERESQPTCFADRDGTERLFVRVVEHAEVASAAFHELRQSATGSVSTYLRLATTFDRLGRVARREDHRAALRDHLDRLERAVDADRLEDRDRSEIMARVTAARRVLLDVAPG